MADGMLTKVSKYDLDRNSLDFKELNKMKSQVFKENQINKYKQI